MPIARRPASPVTAPMLSQTVAVSIVAERPLTGYDDEKSLKSRTF